jgi:hypothetical protein
MANLSFMAGGRRRRLFRRKASGPFYVRFNHNGKDQPRSLGTTNESAAKEKAKQIIEAALSGDIKTSRKLKIRSDYCTLRQVADVYIDKFARDARTKRTARGNVGALEKIVRLAAGLQLEIARSSILTGELIRKFEAAEEPRIARDRNGHVIQESELRVRTSICSVVRQARSVFKRSLINWYDGLPLPDLDHFRRQGVAAPDRPKPRPLDDGVLDKLNADAPRLAKQDPACYVAHLLFSRMGMRNGEIKAARWTWLVRVGDRAKLGIIYRPEEGFKPKKKTERWIPIAASVLAELERFKHLSIDGYIVPAAHKTERALIVDRRHSRWAGQWIKDRSKVSYELRRYAGSLVFKKTRSLEHAQMFLGHADRKTTTDWYWYLLDEIPSIEMDDFAPPMAFAVVA